MHAKTAKDIGRLVRNCRLQRELRQSDVAREAGVSRQWLIALEHGRPGLDLDLTLRVYECLGLEISIYPTRTTPAWALRAWGDACRAKWEKRHRPRRRGGTRSKWRERTGDMSDDAVTTNLPDDLVTKH